MEAGTFSFQGGKVMASADEIYITVKAKGGRGCPHLSADAILAGSHIVIALQQVISRHNDPFNPSVLSITALTAAIPPMLPSEGKTYGYARAMDETPGVSGAHDLIVQTVRGYPQRSVRKRKPGSMWVIPLYGMTRPVGKGHGAGQTVCQPGQCHRNGTTHGAEDFAFILTGYLPVSSGWAQVTGALNITSNVHTPTFNIDEQAIEHGIGMMARWLAISC